MIPKQIPDPPTTWADKLAWLLQVGWILIGTSFESLFTRIPLIDGLQFSVLTIVGAGMIFLSVTVSYLVFKEENRVWLARIESLGPPPQPH